MQQKTPPRLINEKGPYKEVAMLGYQKARGATQDSSTIID